MVGLRVGLVGSDMDEGVDMVADMEEGADMVGLRPVKKVGGVGADMEEGSDGGPPLRGPPFDISWL